MLFSHSKYKGISFCLLIILSTIFELGATSPSEAIEQKNKPANQQEVKKAQPKTNHKKHNKKNKKAEQDTPPEIIKETVKPVVPAPPPPPPLTPDKKKYASPGGNQVMTDGTIINFRDMGIINMHGYRYSYYSSKVLYHRRTAEWYACDDHIYRTAEGYIVVAAKNHPQGAIVPTPFGKGKVLDYCHIDNTIDIYVDF